MNVLFDLNIYKWCAHNHSSLTIVQVHHKKIFIVPQINAEAPNFVISCGWRNALKPHNVLTLVHT
jgi:hypothetical protein